MNSMEKYQKMLSLEPYADRTEIPVYPQMCTTFGVLGGKTQAEIFNSVDAWLESIDATIAAVGKPDMAFPDSPGMAVFGMGMICRAPGRELGENELYQFIEAPYFDDPEEYKKIYDMGYGNWRMKYLMDVQTPAFTDPAQLGAAFGAYGQNVAKVMNYYYSHGIMPSYDAAAMPIFDSLSLARTMADFICDIYEDPGPIMDIVNKYQPIETENTIHRIKANHGSRVCLFAMRSSSAFMSPSMFDEYVWPALSQMIRTYWAAGIRCVVHADSNWLPMLHHFTELPKGCCHIELDGSTDIFQAYEILRGSQSIRGDIPSAMFAFQNPDDISEYCEKLIQMGMKGGFVLGSGCDVPLNTKPENVKAMIDSVRK